MEKDISLLLKDLCCSRCKADFDEKSVKYIHEEKEYKIINLVCQKCGKEFGIAFLKITDNTSDDIKDIILRDNRDKPPIDSNEVIDAHEYIKDFETNWKKFLDN